MEEVHPNPVLRMDDSEESCPVNNNIKPGSILRVESDNEEEDLQSQQGSQSPAVLPKQSWLLRLFESTLFDPSMAMTYLFNSKALTTDLYFLLLKIFQYCVSGTRSVGVHWQ